MECIAASADADKTATAHNRWGRPTNNLFSTVDAVTATERKNLSPVDSLYRHRDDDLAEVLRTEEGLSSRTAAAPPGPMKGHARKRAEALVATGVRAVGDLRMTGEENSRLVRVGGFSYVIGGGGGRAGSGFAGGWGELQGKERGHERCGAAAW